MMNRGVSGNHQKPMLGMGVSCAKTLEDIIASDYEKIGHVTYLNG